MQQFNRKAFMYNSNNVDQIASSMKQIARKVNVISNVLKPSDESELEIALSVIIIELETVKICLENLNLLTEREQKNAVL